MESVPHGPWGCPLVVYEALSGSPWGVLLGSQSVTAIDFSWCFSFSVCGHITIVRFPDAAKQMSKYKVVLSSQDQDKSLVTVETDAHGSFCFKAKPGSYRVQVGGQHFRLMHHHWLFRRLCLSHSFHGGCDGPYGGSLPPPTPPCHP